MDIDEFKSGEYKEQFQYKSFSPSKVDHEWKWNDEEIDSLLKAAENKLNKLNELVSSTNIEDGMLDLFLTKEAIASCRLEGAKITFDEFMNGMTAQNKDEWNDVQNYVNAAKTGFEELVRLPLSTRVLNEMHIELMNNGRGEKKTPGEFRRSQNWVGGKTLKEAIYVPPTHEELGELFRDLEYFIHNEEIKLPNIIKLAIVHYQFFALQPYLDGNGKLNRLMVTLFLNEFKMLGAPVLVLSEVLEKSKTEYLVKLNAVRERNGMALWIKFFLKAVDRAGDLAFERIKNLTELAEVKHNQDETGSEKFKQRIAANIF